MAEQPTPSAPTPSADDVNEQVAKLREQVETLMRERVTPVIADAAGRAESALDAMREQTEAMSERVKDKPLIAAAMALGIGFVVGRILS